MLRWELSTGNRTEDDYESCCWKHAPVHDSDWPSILPHHKTVLKSRNASKQQVSWSLEPFSPCEWWGHLSSACENSLWWLAGCSDPLDRCPRAACCKKPLLKIRWLWMSSRVLAVASATAWLSHPVVLVTAVIKENYKGGWRFHTSSGHTGTAAVGMSSEAPASLGTWAAVLSWESIRIRHPTLPPPGSTLMMGTLGISNAIWRLPGFRDDNGTAIWGDVCKSLLAQKCLFGLPSWHAWWCWDLKAIFQEVKKAIHCDFYGGDLFQYMDRNCSHNSKEIAKRGKRGMGFYAHKMERNKKCSVFWDMFQESGLIIFKFLWGLGFGFCSLKVYKCFWEWHFFPIKKRKKF